MSAQAGVTQTQQECYLCGSEATTRDHVPPRCFFDVVPENIITLPACFPCNNAHSKDEEYFRAIVLAQCYAHCELARRIWEGPVRRGIWRKGFDGLRRRLLANSSLLTLPRSGGLQVAVFNVEGGRAARVVRKIAKGLFQHLRGRRLEEGDLIIFRDGDVKNLDMERITRNWTEINMGEEFRCRSDFDGNGGAVWFQFYRFNWWLALIGEAARKYPRPK